MAAGLEPNAENKLFVGGCPAGCGEEELRNLFEKHGQVEEVFVMRGGSRSGMVCAFVRFSTQAMARQAINAIHGQHTLPNASEPLVVRWADAPGSRKRDGREGGKRRNSNSKFDAYGGPSMALHMQMMHMNGGAFPAMAPPMAMVSPPMGPQPTGGYGAYAGTGYYAGQQPTGGTQFYGGSMMGYPPQVMQYMPQAMGWQSGSPSFGASSPLVAGAGMMGGAPPLMHLSQSLVENGGVQGAYASGPGPASPMVVGQAGMM